MSIPLKPSRSQGRRKSWVRGPHEGEVAMVHRKKLIGALAFYFAFILLVS